MQKLNFIFLAVLICTDVHAKDFMTNSVDIKNAPDWVRQTKVESITDRIQSKLEWSTRRVNMFWYKTQQEFDQVHNYGAMATAVTKHTNGVSAIHMGPNVDQKNFEEIFGHELVHVIVYQKYKTSIPKWLEEGLANHLASRGKVNYKWLASQPFPADVKELAHPFKGSTSGVLYRYKASQAFAEMLDAKCDLENLIRLSVERKMEDYMSTYCEIKDLNAAFQAWVKKRG